MANKENTTLGIGKSADFGVMHSPQPSRARTHAHVVRPTGILKESLLDLPGARARVREESADFTAWRVKTFGGNFDPVREAVEDAVAEFSDRQPARDRSLWLTIAKAIGGLTRRNAVPPSRLLAATSLRSCARLRLRGFPSKQSFFGAFGVPRNTSRPLQATLALKVCLRTWKVAEE